MRVRKKVSGGAEAERRRSVREKIADTVDVSKEILLNSVKVVLIGNREITVENYKGIVEYTAETVVLDANPHRIRLDGKNLTVRAITGELLCVEGEISKLAFRKEE